MISSLAFALGRLFFLLMGASALCVLFGFLVLEWRQANLALRLFHRAQDAWWMAIATGVAWMVVTRPLARWRRG